MNLLKLVKCASSRLLRLRTPLHGSNCPLPGLLSLMRPQVHLRGTRTLNLGQLGDPFLLSTSVRGESSEGGYTRALREDNVSAKCSARYYMAVRIQNMISKVPTLRFFSRLLVALIPS